MTGSASLMWPDLPTTGFMSGRAATMEDLKSGQAAFVSMVGETPTGRPHDIPIPQYALARLDSDAHVPVIVIQAEDTPKGTIVGAISLEGNVHVLMLEELRLLGVQVPTEQT